MFFQPNVLLLLLPQTERARARYRVSPHGEPQPKTRDIFAGNSGENGDSVGSQSVQCKRRSGFPAAHRDKHVRKYVGPVEADATATCCFAALNTDLHLMAFRGENRGSASCLCVCLWGPEADQADEAAGSMQRCSSSEAAGGDSLNLIDRPH